MIQSYVITYPSRCRSLLCNPKSPWSMCILTQGLLHMIHRHHELAHIPFVWTPPRIRPHVFSEKRRRCHALPARGRPPRQRLGIPGKASTPSTQRPVGWGQHRGAALRATPAGPGKHCGEAGRGCRTAPLYTGRCPYTGSGLSPYLHACVPECFHGDPLPHGGTMAWNA